MIIHQQTLNLSPVFAIICPRSVNCKGVSHCHMVVKLIVYARSKWRKEAPAFSVWVNM